MLSHVLRRDMPSKCDYRIDEWLTLSKSAKYSCREGSVKTLLVRICNASQQKN